MTSINSQDFELGSFIDREEREDMNNCESN
jgi:hypothetical protein